MSYNEYILVPKSIEDLVYNLHVAVGNFENNPTPVTLSHIQIMVDEATEFMGKTSAPDNVEAD